MSPKATAREEYTVDDGEVVTGGQQELSSMVAVGMKRGWQCNERKMGDGTRVEKKAKGERFRDR